MSKTPDQLIALFTPLCDALAVELVDVEVRPGHLLVTIERDGGTDLEVITTVTRTISSCLDANEQLAPNANYELEVSSPGLERRLRRPEHFAKALGSVVAIRTVASSNGERRVEGEIVATTIDDVTIKTATGHRSIRYEEIERAHTVVDWRAAFASDRGSATRTTRVASS